jgi:primase-polymerase (primpol)-like protein
MEIERGRPAKMPYSISGYRASTTSPRDWAPFECALDAWREEPQQYAGLGSVFVKEDGLAGVDLDDCLLRGDELKPWAQEIVHLLADSYMEVSPSGQGIKIWVRGRLAANVPGVKIGDGQIEMYDHARYFTVTGRVFRGAPIQVEEHAHDLDLLYKRFVGDRKGWPVQPLENGRIPHGQQHNTLVSIAGTLRARRICDQAIEACLQAINRYQCEIPGPPENILRIVRSTRTWGAK